MTIAKHRIPMCDAAVLARVSFQRPPLTRRRSCRGRRNEAFDQDDPLHLSSFPLRFSLCAHFPSPFAPPYSSPRATLITTFTPLPQFPPLSFSNSLAVTTLRPFTQGSTLLTLASPPSSIAGATTPGPPRYHIAGSRPSTPALTHPPSLHF